MKRIDLFDMFSNSFVQTWKHQLIQGLLFVVLGIVIALFPQLLVAMFASFFVVIGLVMITSAWTLKKYSKRYSLFSDELFDLI